VTPCASAPQFSNADHFTPKIEAYCKNSKLFLYISSGWVKIVSNILNQLPMLPIYWLWFEEGGVLLNLLKKKTSK
jgi:hypothetical protein